MSLMISIDVLLIAIFYKVADKMFLWLDNFYLGLTLWGS